MTEEVHYKLLRLLEQNPEATQREISLELGISLGKVNYCLRALVQKGHLKAENFKNSKNKAAYLYVLTPRGVSAKGKIAMSYLNRKLIEYEDLRMEIEQIKGELRGTSGYV